MLTPRPNGRKCSLKWGGFSAIISMTPGCTAWTGRPFAKNITPFLGHVGHRDDLNYLLADMMGELVVGHVFVGGGDMDKIDDRGVGLLGADYRVVDGFYQITRIYRGQNWHPELRAPLTEPAQWAPAM